MRNGQGGLIRVEKAMLSQLPILNLSAAWGGVSHDFQSMSASFRKPYIVIWLRKPLDLDVVSWSNHSGTAPLVVISVSV